MTPIIEVKDVTRTYGSGPTATAALRGVSLTVGEGQLVALRGRSGSGKTTLLNIVGGLDAPDSGTVRVDGKDVTAMSERERMRLRRDVGGFYLPVVRPPARAVGGGERRRAAAHRRCGPVGSRGARPAHARPRRPGRATPGSGPASCPAASSSGSRSPAPSRLARRLLLADEPTGQLDAETGKQIMRLLRSVVRTEGVTALLATHDPTLMDIADSVLDLADGTIREKG